MSRFKIVLLLISLYLTFSVADQQEINRRFQEALFTEESEGDLEKAISTYQSILEEATKDTAASKELEETITKTEFQLGLCYLKKGDKENAIAQFKKVLDHTYSGHNEHYNKARNYLEELNPEFAEKPMEIAFTRTPWGAYEKCRYKVYSQNGGEIGETISTIRTNAGKAQITSSELIPVHAYVRHVEMECTPEKFTPLSCLTKIADHWKWKATYDGSTINYNSDTRGKKSNNTTTYKQQIFDYEQVRHLVRRLPLKVGYHDSTMIFTTTSGMHSKGQLKVVGTENVKTPMGSFNCFKAEVSASLQGDQNYTQTLWISNDDHRYVVQSKSGKLTDKLILVEDEENLSEKVVRDDSLDVTIELPKGYEYYKSLTTMQFNTMIQIFHPNTMAWSVLASEEKSKTQSNSDYVKNEIKKYNNWYKKYKVRNNSTVEGTINGIPTIQQVVDLKFNSGNPSITEYRTYFFTEKKVHCLIIRTTKEQLPKHKETFDALIQAVKKV